jgi:DNA-directed RNA polymerase specialized sigma24 family protein
MSILHPIRGRRTNEELFFERYSQIFGWALQLVHSNRTDAEDLVQDFYIQVMRINVALAEVDEIEPYLFKSPAQPPLLAAAAGGQKPDL